MAITKPLVTTTVEVLHMSDAYVFKDKVANGTVTRDGSNVRYQILHGDTIVGKTDDGILMEIPYHAVVMATVETANSDPIEEPEDNFCVEA